MAGGQEGSPPPPLLRGLGRLLGAESAGSYVVQGLSLDQLVSNVFSAAFTRAGELGVLHVHGFFAVGHFAIKEKLV